MVFTEHYVENYTLESIAKVTLQYYYFNPFTRQYIFPEDFEKFSTFKFFYQPYTIGGNIIWNIWKSSKILRKLSVAESKDEFLPDELRDFLPENTILAFNRGTPGVEQKMTLLGIDPESHESFFIKFARSKVSIKNVNNEGTNLSQLKHLEFVPQLKLNVTGPDFTIIQTNVFPGERLKNQNLDKQILSILVQIAKQNVQTDNKFKSALRCCFAHGDFCPWNIMVYGDKIKIFDWELSGIYPLGYDLFTFIFQTDFLLHPLRKNIEIIKKKRILIDNYFHEFNIYDWSSFLLEFANLKIELERSRKNFRLLEYFMNLKLYAEKN